jgi:hypothetical protein
LIPSLRVCPVEVHAFMDVLALCASLIAPCGFLFDKRSFDPRRSAVSPCKASLLCLG